MESLNYCLRKSDEGGSTDLTSDFLLALVSEYLIWRVCQCMKTEQRNFQSWCLRRFFCLILLPSLARRLAYFWITRRVLYFCVICPFFQEVTIPIANRFLNLLPQVCFSLTALKSNKLLYFPCLIMRWNFAKASWCRLAIKIRGVFTGTWLRKTERTVCYTLKKFACAPLKQRELSYIQDYSAQKA